MMVCKMITGRYFDDRYGSRVLDVRIPRQAKTYFEKTGRFPDLAHVNPLVCKDETTMIVDGNTILIVPDDRIAPDITWIGVTT